MNVKWTYEKLNDVVQSCVKATNECVYIYILDDCVEGFFEMQEQYFPHIAMLFTNETY